MRRSKKITVPTPDPAEIHRRTRRQIPPPGFSFKDRKKEANRRACRGRVREER